MLVLLLANAARRMLKHSRMLPPATGVNRPRPLLKLWITLLAGACSLTAEAAGRTTEYLLSNGLKLVVQEDHRAPVAVVQVWYKVGGSYEQDGATGTSHALEHLMFKRTTTLGSGEFSKIVAARGGQENAFTSADYTAYFQQWSAENVGLSFKLEADRMQHLVLDAEEFNNERKVIREERRMRTDDDPQALAAEALTATIWQTSPYRQPVIGWAADIENMQLPDLRRWYERWYTPNNATVVVVGDVDPRAVLALAKQHFGPLPSRPIVPLMPRPEVPQHGEKRLTLYDEKVREPLLMLAFKAPVMSMVGAAGVDGKPIEAWEIYALDVLAGVLDGGASARFSSKLVRGQELAVAASASYSAAARLEDLFSIDAMPRAGTTLKQLERAIDVELALLKASPPLAEELERVKNQVRAGTVYQQDSMFYQAMIIGTLESVGLSWKLKDQYDAGILAVTPAQVQAVARKYLVRQRASVAWLMPPEKN